jgi:hypothetical protein
MSLILALSEFDLAWYRLDVELVLVVGKSSDRLFLLLSGNEYSGIDSTVS